MQQIAARESIRNSVRPTGVVWHSAEIIPFPVTSKSPPDPYADLRRAVNAKVRRDYARLDAAFACKSIKVTEAHHKRYDFLIVAGKIIGGICDGREVDTRRPIRLRKKFKSQSYADLIRAARPIDAEGNPLPASKSAQAASWADLRLAGKAYCGHSAFDIWKSVNGAFERERFRATYPRGKDHQITYRAKPKLCSQYFVIGDAPENLVSNDAKSGSKQNDQRRKGVSRRQLLTAEAQAALLERYRNGDADAGRHLIARYQPMVIRIATEFAKQFNAPVEDLVQVAFSGTSAHDGIAYALKQYRPELGAFSSFAEQAIRWAIFRHLNKSRHSETVSLDTDGTEKNEDGNRESRKDSVADLPDDYSAEDLEFADLEPYRARLNELMGCLNDRERSIFESLYGLNGKSRQTATEIGDALGITRQRIQQISARTLKKISEQTGNRQGGGE